MRVTGRLLGRVLLGLALGFAGVGHLTFARRTFQAQVPPWLGLDPDLVVLASGVVEVGLALALLLAPSRVRPLVGWVVAAFFVAVLPGNVSQLLTRTDAFGLDTDTARAVRLMFQPLLVLWALWSTGAWRAWRASRRSARTSTSAGGAPDPGGRVGQHRQPDRPGDDARSPRST